MDLATLIGLLACFGCVTSSILLGGDPMAFIHVPSMAIVVGGMVSSTMIHFSMDQFFSIFAIVKKTLLFKLPSEGDLTQQMVNFSAINRRDGVLALEQQIAKLDDQFLIKGLQMVIDGQDAETIEDQLIVDIQYLQERHSVGKKILDFMGASAPAFGMIGTLIGLVQMLGNLSDPSSIGAGMAVALITTFYGAVLANVVFIPLSGKLAIRSQGEMILREMTVVGLLGISRGESPTNVRERMQAFVSDKHREELKPSI